MQQITILGDSYADEIGDDFLITLLCHGGSHIDWFNIAAYGYYAHPPNTEYRWYPRTLFTTLVLVRAVLVHIFKGFYSRKNCFCVFSMPGKQNARKK